MTTAEKELAKGRSASARLPAIWLSNPYAQQLVQKPGMAAADRTAQRFSDHPYGWPAGAGDLSRCFMATARRTDATRWSSIGGFDERTHPTTRVVVHSDALHVTERITAHRRTT